VNCALPVPRSDIRHARPCAGHPRPWLHHMKKEDVDGRVVEREDALHAFARL